MRKIDEELKKLCDKKFEHFKKAIDEDRDDR